MSPSHSLLPPLTPSSSTFPFLHPSPTTKPSLSLPQTHHHHHHHHPHQTSHFSEPGRAPKPASARTRIRTRISQLCKDGHVDAARRLFDSLPRPLPTILWNTLLIGYVCNSMPHLALHLYSLMNSTTNHNPPPPPPPPHSDHYTYSSALTACAHTGHLALGKSIHCHVIRRLGTPKNPVLNNSLLNMYASSTSSDVVLRVFDGMPKRNVVAWNTMIAWYTGSQLVEDALVMFKRMVEVGVRPTAVSFINVFPAAAEIRSRECGDGLYGMVVKCGREFVEDVFVVSSAVFMYSELSDVESARRVFDLAEERNVEVWNTMIGGYVVNERCEEAVKLFVEVLESEEVSADSVTFLNSLMAVSQMQDVRLGQQVHAYLIKDQSLDSLPLILRNALVVMYSRCGCVHLAFDLFHQMHERDIVTWNTMVSAFIQKDLNLEGLLLVREMQKQGFVVDSVTISALLSAASNLGCLRIGRETHGYLIRHGFKCEGMESYLIDMYSKSGRVDIARWLFDDTQVEERDQVTWNAMIAGFMQNGGNEEALYLFRKMISEENQTPNSVSLSSILPACDPVGGIQTGKEIHGFAIRHDLDKNVFVGTALVDMYSRCGEIISAERVFDWMEDRNTVTYTTMVSGFGQHGLGEKALQLFYSMQRSGVKPDSVTFVAVLSACSYSGLVNEGLALYESMKEYGVVAAPEHYCCVVDLFGRAGRVEEAYDFVQGLGEENTTIGVWGSLLAACRVHQKFKLVKLVSNRLFDMEKGSGSDTAGYHVLLSNVYAAEGKWEKVNRVRKEMTAKGLRKEPGLSCIDVGDASDRFMSRDQKHPENDQIYAMLEELAVEMRFSDSKPIDTSLVPGISD